MRWAIETKRKAKGRQVKQEECVDEDVEEPQKQLSGRVMDDRP